MRDQIRAGGHTQSTRLSCKTGLASPNTPFSETLPPQSSVSSANGPRRLTAGWTQQLPLERERSLWFGASCSLTAGLKSGQDSGLDIICSPAANEAAALPEGGIAAAPPLLNTNTHDSWVKQTPAVLAAPDAARNHDDSKVKLF